MNVILTIVCAVVVLGFLVFIHEGGHYLSSRMFGIRVSEFMIGLPGPHIGFKHGETKYGITAIPLGGYARVCGMEMGEESPYLKQTLALLFTHGKLTVAQAAELLGISEDDASEALEELVEWGCAVEPKRRDVAQIFCAMEVAPTAKQIRKAKKDGLPQPKHYDVGQPRDVDNIDVLYQNEYKQQYRSLSFWKRSVILLAGIAINLLFAIIAFVVVYSIIGIDIQDTTGAIKHISLDPLRAIQSGFTYIALVIQAVVGLFNPATAGDVVSNSASIIGIAVISKSVFEQGFVYLLEFMAMISVSLGIMNVLPIPPLDGGRFIIEVFQRVTRKLVPPKVLGYMSAVGMALMMLLFVVMINQDVQRFIFGNW